MDFNHSVRAKAGILVLAIFPLVSNLLALKSSEELFFQQNFSGGKYVSADKITLYEKQHEALKKILPPHSVVGYIPTGKESSLILQYTLAPVVVIDAPDREFVISDSYDKADVKKFYPDSRLILFKDFGNGVRLFRSEKR